MAGIDRAGFCAWGNRLMDDFNAGRKTWAEAERRFRFVLPCIPVGAVHEAMRSGHRFYIAPKAGIVWGENPARRT